MNAVVYRGANTHEIETRVAEASAQAKERGGRGVGTIARSRIATGNTEALRADPRRDRAIPGRSPAGRRSRANDVTGTTASLASPASARVNGIVVPVDGGRPGR
ncbi:SDR family oxidoreductase [Streptomyces neyagawaensis]|uniref:SDR family oxidoreductase n=1 Tax=Streptomyces neyagawaensis TaxID=42238 RepID=UPI0006E4097A|nr:SDR family oxidoreductase [Streptomyces neyagawaensis]MCL6735897.1 SDR family oxidoreductase [Streptomyces neyagawaensis]MDE1686299.1 SDR family oxidoreductase [Streptomyces neyagawaensis]